MKRKLVASVVIAGVVGVGCGGEMEPAVGGAQEVLARVEQGVTSVTPEPLSSNLLGDTSRVFPEGRAPVSGDADFRDDSDPNVRVLQDNTEVFVTFISSASLKNNTLVYFTYLDGQPPTSAPALTQSNVVFAAAKNLSSGARVSLGRFNRGTRVGFALIPDGGVSGTANLSGTKYWSVASLNAGNTYFVAKHHKAELRRVIGAEDTALSSSDRDYNDTLFTVRTSPPETALNTFVQSGNWGPPGYGYARDGWYVGDFNGDGKDDIFRYIPGLSEPDMFLSTGSAFQAAGRWTTALYGDAANGWYVGDFNGDGKDDIFRYLAGSAGADVFLSTGTSFQRSGVWTTDGYGSARDGWYVGDFNGDGKDDIFRYMPGSGVGAEVYLSTGTSFQRSGVWTTLGYGNAANGWYVGDFNGDGRDDIARYMPGSSGADVLLSTGSGFNRVGSWTPDGYGDARDGWYVGDFNGDGREDIFRYLDGISGADMYYSNNVSFVRGKSWSPAGYGDSPRGWYVGDFDGDGRDDIFRYRDGISGADVFLSR